MRTDANQKTVFHIVFSPSTNSILTTNPVDHTNPPMTKMERVSYQKIFPLGQYINEKIGVDILVNDGEDPMQLLEQARLMVHEFHEKNNGHPDTVPGDHPIPVVQIDRQSNDADLEFKLVKSNVLAAKTKKEALDIIHASGFKYHKELKEIAESKPVKK